jgi:hypothetical protein
LQPIAIPAAVPQLVDGAGRLAQTVPIDLPGLDVGHRLQGASLDPCKNRLAGYAEASSSLRYREAGGMLDILEQAGSGLDRPKGGITLVG